MEWKLRARNMLTYTTTEPFSGRTSLLSNNWKKWVQFFFPCLVMYHCWNESFDFATPLILCSMHLCLKETFSDVYLLFERIVVHRRLQTFFLYASTNHHSQNHSFVNPLFFVREPTLNNPAVQIVCVGKVSVVTDIQTMWCHERLL